jgi:glycosyltransferase EpsJ
MTNEITHTITDDPLVSVVIPVYNTAPNLLHRCLSSIAKQNKDGIAVECIVVFDGKPEQNLREIVRKFPFVRVITIDHAGVSAARNEGIQQATGKWITFVDADDALAEQALLELVRFGDQHECEMVQGAYVNRLGVKQESHSYRKIPAVFTNLNLFEFQKDILNPDTGVSTVWGKVFRRQALASNGTHFDTMLNMGEDSTFVFEAASRAHVIGFIPKVVYMYQRQTDSAVSSFRDDYVDRIDAALDAMQLSLQTVPDSSQYGASYQIYVLFHLLLIQQHYIFNPSAPWSNVQRRVAYSRIRKKERYQDALHSKSIRAFPFAKRVALLALRLNFYTMSKDISLVRRHQLTHLNINNQSS